ncbi:MAG: aminodeoxychorismate synthase component I, partial [bacterium]
MGTSVEELNYTQDTGAVFAAFAGRPWSIFLDSGAYGGERARYDIFSAEPSVTLTTRGPRTEIKTPRALSISEECPFELVKRSLGE